MATEGRLCIMSYNSEVQERPNGPWSKAFRDRVVKVKDALGYSLADLGATFDFSGSFIHGLMTGKKSYHMASKHAARVLQALEGLEVQAGIRKVAAPTADQPVDLAELVRKIHEMGFSVELKRLSA